MSDIAFHRSTADEKDEAGRPASEIIERVNEILGYDVLGYDLAETTAIERDSELYERAVQRASTAGSTVPAEDVLGDLE